MIDAKEFIERRRDKRFAVQNGIAALPRSSTETIGSIVDISRGGISLRYTPTEKQNGTSPVIDILLTDHNFYISGVPVTTKFDFRLENTIPFSYIYERRCGMQFGDLTAHQLNQLDELLAKFVIKED